MTGTINSNSLAFSASKIYFDSCMKVNGIIACDGCRVVMVSDFHGMIIVSENITDSRYYGIY